MNELSYFINALLLFTQSRRYLEIGVMAGVTFNQVTNHTTKTGVDPKFLFPIDQYSSPSSRFETVTSDEFFKGNKNIYDVVFLDGLHTFEQTLRDLVSAISILSYENSFILIDDIWPTDLYSSVSDQELCYELRRETFGSSKIPMDWRGDVYKIIFFAESYLPSWKSSIVVEEDGGNHRLILHRGTSKSLASTSRSLEEIERMDYLTFRKMRSDLVLTTNNDFLRQQLPPAGY